MPVIAGFYFSMLVFSAITPHPPILIPTIGQDSLEQIKKTKEAMQELARDFYVSQPGTVIIISPHGKLLENAFTLNTSPEFTVSFKQFGDLETELKFMGDVELAYQVKEALETEIPLQLISDPELDHGVGVPLYYLGQNTKNIKVVSLGYTSADLKTHFALGQELTEIIRQSPKRIAVVASGDLSHCLTKQAPAPYSPQGKKFDKKLIELLKEKEIDSILNLEPKFIQAAAECGLKSVVILLGVLSEFNYTPQILSYQGPFGVGYLVCNFELSR